MRSAIPSLVLAAFVVSILTGSAVADQPRTWIDVVNHATENDNLIVIDFYADWCAPCKVFDRDAQEVENLRRRLEKITLWRLNGERQGKTLAERFAVQGFPTFVVVDREMYTIDQWFGYYGPDDWVRRVDLAALDPTIYDQRIARYQTVRSSLDAEVLARIHETRGEYTEAARFLTDLVELDPDAAAEHQAALFRAMAAGAALGQFTPDAVVAKADEILATGEMSRSDHIMIAAYLGEMFQRAGEPERWDPYLEAAVEATEGVTDEIAAHQRQWMLVDYALRIQKDPQAAVAARRALLPEGWWEEPDYLNSFAWWCFEQKLNLEEAETLARRAVELETRPAEKANFLDTVAEICHARGDVAGAVTSIESALRLDPSNRYLRQQHRRFQKALASAG